MMFRRQIYIRETFRGLLYENGAFVKVLEPGKFEYWNLPWSNKKEIVLVDIRQRSLTIKGQEILTADKVAIGVSILVNFRVLNPQAAVHEVESFSDRIYEDVQLSARRYLGGKTLEGILQDRNEVSNAVRADVKEAAASYGIEILRADVKDLVFPGRLREIMNQVLETERTSEAKLIEARKTAEARKIYNEAERQAIQTKLEAERSLAELLEKSPAMLRLRELETLEKIAAKPGNSFYIGLGEMIKPTPKSAA